MNIERWYAAYTQPRHEKKVVAHLGLREVECFLPLYVAPRRWNNGVKVNLELPLFPGYVFVKLSLERQFQVLSTPSIIRLVGSESRPLPIAMHEMDVLMHRIQPLKPEPHPFIQVGDRVRIKSGPLAGLEGILLQKKDRCRFVLSMDLIMQSISVEVDAADIDYQSVVHSHSVSPSCQAYSAN